MEMDRSHIARSWSEPVTAAAGNSATSLGTLRQKLAALEAPRSNAGGARARYVARVEAVRWLNRLDEADCLDEVWPQFEVWVTARPENQEMVVAVERTRHALEELTAWFPPEGSEAALQLLRLCDRDRRARLSGVREVAHWVLMTGPLAICAVALWLFIY